MRLATYLIFFALLTPSAALAGIQAAPEQSVNVLRTSDSAIDTLERLHEKAESQIIRNDFNDAIRTYSDILLMEPDDETAYTGLGNCYLVLGQYKKADEAFHNALSINPQNETAIVGIQKIMDPDGVEGMVHPAQIEAEESQASTTPSLEIQPAPVSVAAKPQPQAPLSLSPKEPAKPQPAAKPETILKTSPQASGAFRLPAFLSDLLPHKAAPLPRRKAEVRPTSAGPAAPAKQAPIQTVVNIRPKAILNRLPRLSPEKVSVSVAAPKTAEKTPKPSFVPSPKVSAQMENASATRDTVDANQIQRALRNTGFYSGPIDGVLGPVSRAAIKNFQELHEMETDGVVGPKTWASLRLYLD